MKLLKSTYIFMLATLAAGAAGCDNNTDMPQAAGYDGITLMLNISDLASEPMARSLSLPASDIERVNTLRVIIARPSGAIEANRLIIPVDGAIHRSDITFKVKANEDKYVYLIANEAATRHDLSTITSVSPAALDDPDADEYANDLVNITVDGIAENEPVPMSCVYRLSASQTHAVKDAEGKYCINYDLTLMRTLVKFTFNIYNNRSIDFDISSLAIDCATSSSYRLFARVQRLADGASIVHYLTANGNDNITESGTGRAPGYTSIAESAGTNTDHFLEFYQAQTASGYNEFLSADIKLNASTTKLTRTCYYYESNPASTLSVPYRLKVDFESNSFIESLDNLPVLPRNTHVVINLTFKNSDKILDIDIEPYTIVDLRPEFGQ